MQMVLRFEVWSFLIGLLTIICYQLLIGQIHTRRLLYDKGRIRRGFSPARLQLLVFTIAVAVYFIIKVLSANTGKLPKLPNEILFLLIGSQLFYLGSKMVSIWRETLLPKVQKPPTL